MSVCGFDFGCVWEIFQTLHSLPCTTIRKSRWLRYLCLLWENSVLRVDDIKFSTENTMPYCQRSAKYVWLIVILDEDLSFALGGCHKRIDWMVSFIDFVVRWLIDLFDWFESGIWAMWQKNAKYIAEYKLEADLILIRKLKFWQQNLLGPPENLVCAPTDQKRLSKQIYLWVRCRKKTHGFWDNRPNLLTRFSGGPTHFVFRCG
jgi:hypothetical protein